MQAYGNFVSFKKFLSLKSRHAILGLLVHPVGKDLLGWIRI
jgi:hypothetical protein